MASEISIKRLSKDRIKDVQYIIKKVFKKNLTLAFLDHKFNTKQYCDFEYLCCLAYQNDKPIGFYGATPLVLTNNYEKHLFVQIHDSFILKEYQGKGIYKEMANFSNKLMMEVGVKAIFAYHSEQTYYSLGKFGWKDGYYLKRTHLKINKKIPLLKLYNKFPLFSSLKKKRIKYVLKKYTISNVIKNELTNLNFHVNYTKKYIRYKNHFNPTIVAINDCKIWLKFDGFITIGLFENLNTKNFNNVMDELKIIAKKIGANEIHIPFNPNVKYASLINKNMQVHNSFHLGYYLFDESINFNNYQFNYIELDTFL